MTSDANHAVWPTPATIADFSYSKLSHFELFRGLAFRSYDVGDPDPAICDLKVYQDYLTYCFILRNVPPGSRILDVGGGDSRVLKFLSKEYECWNADKCEGLGNGPIRFSSPIIELSTTMSAPLTASCLITILISFSPSLALEHSPRIKLFASKCSRTSIGY